jgi:hypothetical protein
MLPLYCLLGLLRGERWRLGGDARTGEELRVYTDG